MSIRFFLVVNILVFFACFSGYTQETKLTPVTPEAAALTKMVNYPVDYNTGVPDIRIPFYEINVGNIKLPVDLVYHAGGFRINEQATRAGLGWSLSSDLQITRTINGKDDFSQGGYLNNPLVKTYYRNGSFCPGCAYSDSYQESYYLATGEKDASPDKFNYRLLNKSGSFYFQKNIAGSGYTIVPVPFDNIKIQFNNGQFIITDTDGTTYYFGTPGTGSVSQALAGGMEISGADASGSCPACVTSAWKCKSIFSAQGIEEISFSYTPKTMVTYATYNDYIEYYNNESPCTMYHYYRSSDYPLSGYTNYSSLPAFYELSSPKYMVVYGNSGTSYFHIPYLDNTGNVVDAVYERTNVTNASLQNVHGLSVSEISFRGGKVQFNGTDQLNYIRVLGPSGQELKTAYFFQSYTEPVYKQEAKNYNGLNFQGTRYLDSLHIRSGTETFERYALGYESKYCFGNHLKGHDAWGYPNDNTVEIAYANNTSANIMSLPTIKINQDRFYRSILGGCTDFASDIPIAVTGNDWAEAPNEPAMKRGLLKRIVYPTGGYTDFDFEANRYMEDFYWMGTHNALPQLCGGLRIRSISSFKEDGTFAGQKYYQYGPLEEGSGKLINKPARVKEDGKFYYGAAGYEQQIAYLKVGNPNVTCYNKECLDVYALETKTTYQPASALDYTYSNGAPIYYEKITEYNQDLGKKTGKSVYEYYPPEQFYDYEAPLHAYNRIEGTNINVQRTDGLMGAQKSIKQYKYNTNAKSYEVDQLYQLVRKKEFEYTRYLKPEQVRVNYAFLRVSYPIVEGSFQGSAYTLYNPALSFSTSLNNPGPDFIEGAYGIPVGRLLPGSVTETSYADADSLKTITQYDYDNFPYLNPSKITTTDSKGMQTEKQLKYAYNFGGTAVYDSMVRRNMVTASIEEIEMNITLGNKEIARRKTDYKDFSLGWGVPAPLSISSSVNGAQLREDVRYQEYDPYGNVLELKGRDGLTTSYLWGYHSLYPVAELKGRTYASIPSSYKSNTQIINPGSDGSLRTLLSGLNEPGAVVNVYTYRPLVGISSQTAPNSKTVYYEYDPIGRLTAKKDHNGNIQNQYSYRMRNYSALGALPGYANAPAMRTRNEQSGGFWLFYNMIIRGGNYVGLDQPGVDYVAGSSAETMSLDGAPDNPGTNMMAAIKLRYSIVSPSAIPSTMMMDFIKNDAVVASYRFRPYTATPGEYTVHIPAGTYKASVRLSADYKCPNGCLVYSFYDLSKPAEYSFLQNGDELVLAAGGQYEISIGELN
ncbi:hypothetical protein [Niabella drilacis]|uniref:YD repeat-containing protein n=1 Tax=Niabella drilacis (strain DSM 25811 / CCM 8410 / CCUG 62505 / LMG 26954 / E90) TaxID=1285928 RepID=A0A1G6UUB6_NIADE|nr:hypothetical protein [Niabella drilacis]SDD44155.1 hypothetical protein SAMN04487894_10973 [Niabella drilacis]